MNVWARPRCSSSFVAAGSSASAGTRTDVSVVLVVRQLSRDQKAEIRYLTDYITGRYPG